MATFEPMEKEPVFINAMNLDDYNDLYQQLSPKEKEFRWALADVINKYSRENKSNTPDYILADVMANCLQAFEQGSRHREEWFGKPLTIGGN